MSVNKKWDEKKKKRNIRNLLIFSKDSKFTHLCFDFLWHTGHSNFGSTPK